MPTSDWDNMASICKEIHRLQPATVMDLGVGAGKYGVLAREVLDGIWGRVRPDLWVHRIVGIEAWEEYRNPAWGVYNHIEIGDFFKYPVSQYGLVLMIDSLEHLTAEQGRYMLSRLVVDNNHVIVSVPNGVMKQDDPVYGNPYERHLTTFSGREFDDYRHTVLHNGLCKVVSIEGRA
jgi:hypothetical protein